MIIEQLGYITICEILKNNLNAGYCDIFTNIVNNCAN